MREAQLLMMLAAIERDPGAECTAYKV